MTTMRQSAEASDAVILQAALQIAAHFQERLDELIAMLPFLEVATKPARTQPL